MDISLGDKITFFVYGVNFTHFRQLRVTRVVRALYGTEEKGWSHIGVKFHGDSHFRVPFGNIIKVEKASIGKGDE